MDDLRERAEEIADFAVGERNNHRMYERLAYMALKELRAAVEAEREACAQIARKVGLSAVTKYATEPDCHQAANVAVSNTTYFIEAAIRRSTDNE